MIQAHDAAKVWVSSHTWSPIHKQQGQVSEYDSPVSHQPVHDVKCAPRLVINRGVGECARRLPLSRWLSAENLAPLVQILMFLEFCMRCLHMVGVWEPGKEFISEMYFYRAYLKFFWVMIIFLGYPSTAKTRKIKSGNWWTPKEERRAHILTAENTATKSAAHSY